MKRQKRIICLCLILAMFVTILPCEVKAQGKKTWGEAYEEVLKKYGSDATAKMIIFQKFMWITGKLFYYHIIMGKFIRIIGMIGWICVPMYPNREK